MARKTDVKHPPTPPAEPLLEEIELHGHTYRRGQTISIHGLPGEYKIRRFYVTQQGMEVEVFGGVVGRTMIRQFLADRIVPPDGTDAAVEHRAKTLNADPIRDAIMRDGEVRVPLEDPDDPQAKKRLVNKVFSRAYSLGLKGQFKVRVEDGLVIGWRTEPESAQ